MSRDSVRPKAGSCVLGAARIRAEAGGKAENALADRIENRARVEVDADIGAGGELVLAAEPLGTGMALRNTVLEPDQVAADASRDRLDLADKAGALELGLDVSDTIQADNSLEKMLAHQLAAVHTSTMLMAGQMKRMVDRMDQTEGHARETANVEACRIAGVVSRMSTSFQQGMLTLQRVRSGGRQVVTVQHVHVAEGGQAVVAGSVKGGGRSRSAKGGNGEK